MVERNRKKPQEINQIAYENSVKSENVKDTKKSKKRKRLVKKTVTVLAAAALITASVNFISNGIEKVQDRNAVDDFYSQEGYYECIDDCYWFTRGKDGNKSGYNQLNLASWAASEENPDLALYSIYRRIPENRTWNMDEVIGIMNRFNNNGETYSDFNDYLTKKGFVDKNGEASFEVYDKVMTERVLAEATINEIAVNNGIKR